jgi:hypothetical protein
MATRQEDLYDRDFYQWTQDQASALRHLAEQRWNGPLDLSHLAEEVEDLGRSTRNAVRSQIQRIIEHCLKLEHSSATEPRPGWMNSIDEARDEIENLLTPTLRRDLDHQLFRLFARTRRRVDRDLRAHGEQDAADALPQECPYSLDQLLDEEWLPADGQGSSDHA